MNLTPEELDAKWAAAKQDIVDAAKTAGIDPGVMAQVAGFESNFDPHARPIAGRKHADLNTITQFDGTKAMSSAYGYGQFLNKTWAGMVREHGEKYGIENAANLTDAQTNTAEMRNNTKLQAGMLAELTRENIDRGAKLGGPDPIANVYALHNLGSGDGSKFLKGLAAHPDAKVSSILSNDVISRNPSLYGDGSISIEAAYKTMGKQMNDYVKYANEVTHGRAAVTPAPAVKPHVEPATHGEKPARSSAGTRTLNVGDHGTDVTALQTQLNKLGFKDAKGEALRTDGHFGPSTKAAVEAFQEKHRMEVDGVVGANTRSQLATEAHAHDRTAPAKAAAPQLNQPEHKDYGMFKQALAGVQQIDAAHGRVSDHRSENLAGTLVASSLVAGMSRIDNVALSDDAQRAFAVQGAANSPFKQYAEVNVTQGLSTPLAQSTQAVDSLQPAVQTQQQVAQQSQQQQQDGQQQQQQQQQAQQQSIQR